MTRTDIEQEYFDWMYNTVTNGRFAKENSFRKLLTFLHEVEFYYVIPKDSNRAEDGEDLRWRFVCEKNMNRYDRDWALDCLARPCSVLEMMVSLAIRCEELMDDPSFGDRTGQWFWKMIVNLGLGGMYDTRFAECEIYAEDIIQRFLRRDFEPDGKGSLFYVRDCPQDMRKLEIWNAMLCYLATIT